MEPKIEITQMPTKEMLEAFLSHMVLGTEVTVVFNTEDGVFEQHEV